MESDGRQEYCKLCKALQPVIEDRSNGAYVCGGGCGLVLDMYLDDRSEWRTFSNNDKGEGADRSRGGDAIDENFSDQTNLATTLAGGGDKNRGIVGASKRYAMGEASDRSFQKASKAINQLCTRLQLPTKTAERARTYFKKTEKEAKGLHLNALVAASMIVACKQDNFQITIKEMSAHTKVKQSHIGQAQKAIHKAIGYKIYANAVSTVPRFLHILGISSLKVRKHTELLIEAVNRKLICGGRSPLSVVAASLLFASSLSDTPKSLKEIHEATKVGEPTIIIAYKHLYEKKDELYFGEQYFEGKTLESLPKF